jgi:phytoene dehydrogenase-like protein
MIGQGTPRTEASESEVVPAGQARGSRYDVVVIGAGMGGLTAGALLARAGKNVLVVEAGSVPGGHAQVIRSGPYTFDSCDHLTWGCEEVTPFGPGLIDAVLRHLGVRDRCEFVRMADPIYEARFPGLTLPVPSGREAYVEAHARQFPAEGAALRRLAELHAAILLELNALPVKPRARDLLSMRRFPMVFRYRNATVRDVIDREMTDPRLKNLYATLWSWIGPPPAQASFLAFAGMMAAYVEDGAYYPVGSFQRLADAVAAGLTTAGGELLLGVPVTRILADRRRVVGVELTGGQRIRAPVVISNVDARETFGEMLGSNHVPITYRRRLQRMAVSPSMVVLYAATDLDVASFEVPHDVTLSTRWGNEQSGAASPEEIAELSILIPTLKDRSLAPPGEHLVILKAVAPGSWDGSGAGGVFADRMLELAERILPGLRQHLTFVYESPPGTGSGTRLRLVGPIYGWATTPRQIGVRRLPQETPVAGLFLAGHWSQPAHGLVPVMVSGIRVARIVLGASTSAPAVPLQL